MQKTIVALIGILLMAGLTRANIVFLETFPNPDGDSPLTNINWNAAVTTSGTVVYADSANSGYPILSTGTFLYTNGGVTAIKEKPWLAWTDSVAIGLFGNITNITMDLKNALSSENLKIALKVDGSWYVSQDVFNSPDATAFVTVGLFDVQSAAWNNLSFAPDSTLVEGGAAGSLSGVVQAIGVFDASASGVARIDNLTVKSRMDPASETVFLEIFPNTSGDSPLTNINWNAAVTTDGTVYTGGTGSEGPILSSQDYIYMSGGSTAVVGKPWLAWTDAVAIGSFGYIDYITMDLRNNRATENLKIAVKVDGSWYVSQDVFNSPDDSAFVTVGLLYVQGAKWNELDFTAGSTLVEGGAADTPSGTVQAIGAFDASALSKIRIDNLTVKSTIIIPSGTRITVY